MNQANLSADQPAALPPSEAAPPSQPERLRHIFMSSSGLRVGWRLLLYLAMMTTITLLLLFVIQPWQASEELTELWDQLLWEAVSLAAAIIPALILAKVEKTPFGAYGLPWSHAFGKLFWLGSGWGLLAITLLVGSIYGSGGFSFGHVALDGARIVEFALFWAGFFVMVGCYEEFLFRGYLQFTLAPSMGFWPAAVLFSVLFGSVHLANPGEAWVGAISAALIGFFFCLTLRRTGNLWFAVGFHFAFDWGETFIYSVPNSGFNPPGHLLSSHFHGPRWLTGGTIGPEGSVFTFLWLIVLWIAFDRVYPQVKYPVSPSPAGFEHPGPPASAEPESRALDLRT